MKIEELQKEWREVKFKPKSHRELRGMMYASPTLRVRKIQWKELLRFCLSALFIVAFTLAFDLMNDWSTGIFVVWGVILFVDEYVGLRYMRFLPQQETIQKTLLESITWMQRAVVLSRITYASLWIIVVLILYLNLHLDLLATVEWALMLLPVAVAVNWWSSRKWTRKVEEVRAMLRDINDEMDLVTGGQ